MKRLSIYCALASVVLAASTGAQAQTTGSLGGGTGTFLSLSNLGLEGGTVATLTGGTVLNSDQPFADIPAGSVYGPAFLASGPTVGQPATLNFTTGVDYLSFLWGSPDTYNVLTITTNLGFSTNFTAPGLGFPVTNGDQSFSQYVRFSPVAGQLISSVSFTNSPRTDAFETANFSITSSVPEPATWAMMLMGFGAIGSSMRSARRKTTVSYATI